MPTRINKAQLDFALLLNLVKRPLLGVAPHDPLKQRFENVVIRVVIGLTTLHFGARWRQEARTVKCRP